MKRSGRREFYRVSLAIIKEMQEENIRIHFTDMVYKLTSCIKFVLNHFLMFEKMKMQNQPWSRSSHTSSVNGNKLWIFGGENEASKLTNTLCEYSIDSHQWNTHNMKQFDQAPMERAGHSMVEYNNCLYIFGGDAGPNVNKGRLNDLWRLNLNDCSEKNAFTKCNALGDKPLKRMKHCAAIYQSFMFVFGGCDDQNYQNGNDQKNEEYDSFNQLFVINVNESEEAMKWHKLSIKGLPQRIRHSFDVFNVMQSDKYFHLSLIVCCGEDKNAYLQNDILIIECNANINEEKKDDDANENIFECIINEKNWKCVKIEQVPFKFSPRFGHCSVMLPMDDKNENNSKRILREMVVFGGYAGEMSVLNDFWLISIEIDVENGSYSLNECKCLAIDNLPSPRHGHSMNLMSDNKLIMYGGINLNFETFADVHIVDVKLTEWKNMKQIQHKQKGGGMTENEKKSAGEQFKNMGFSDQQIDAVLNKAQNFGQALGFLLG